MNCRTTRRDFLKATSTCAAVLGAGVLALRDDFTTEAADQKDQALSDELIPIVDTHQHLWDLGNVKLPWLSGAPQTLNRNYVMSDYLQATRGLNVVKAVYMEVNVAEDDQVQEAEYVIDLCRRDDNPTVAAVIGGSPQSKDFKSYISRFAGNRFVKGVRTVLHDADRPQGMCLAPQFVENIQLLGELGLSFDLCMRPDEILDGVKLVDKCPKTRFVVDHCGNMSVQSTDKKIRDAWEQGLREMSQREHVVCKISGIVVTAKEDWTPADLAPNMQFCLDTFGEDRAYFAGDWPVCTLRASLSQWVNALKTIVRNKPPAFQRKLFHDNAVKFYGL